MTGKKVLEVYQKMVSESEAMKDIWQECIRYCYPQERVSYSSFGGDIKTTGWRRVNPVCSYPVIFAQRLASSLHSNAFPANDYWFDFAIVGNDGNATEKYKAWCRKARDIAHQKIRQGTNFYQESHTLILSLACLGTAGFYTYYKDGGLHFRHIPVHKNFFISTNPDGEVNQVAILHQWTAKEAIEEYGADNVSDNILQAHDSNASSGQTYSFVQLVYPKKLYKEQYSSRNGGKPYGDVTVELESQKVVKVSQHGGFPFAVPRFEVYSDDTYGRSPAMSAMPEIKAVNALRKTLLDAGVRAIKPPLFMNGLLGNANLEAGAVNKFANFDKNSIWTYPTPTEFPVGKELMADILESLKSAFFIDVFQAVEQGKYMTATEVTARTRSKVDNLSPIITRIQKEFSSKVVLRSLELLIENGDIEPPPIDKSGDESYLRVAYISSLDAMVQQGIAAKTMGFVGQVSQLAQAFQIMPDLANTLNGDAIIQSLGDANMLPATFFRSPEEVQARRDAQAMQQQILNQSQADLNNSQSLANLAKAQRDGGDEFLDDVARGMNQ